MNQGGNALKPPAEQRPPLCPRCGHSLVDDKSFLNVIWASTMTVLTCWCAECAWRGDIVESPVTYSVERAE